MQSNLTDRRQSLEQLQTDRTGIRQFWHSMGIDTHQTERDINESLYENEQSLQEFVVKDMKKI